MTLNAGEFVGNLDLKTLADEDLFSAAVQAAEEQCGDDVLWTVDPWDARQDTLREFEISAKEAASLLGCTLSALRKKRERGELTGRQWSRDWCYTIEELIPHLTKRIGARGGQLGRPRISGRRNG